MTKAVSATIGKKLIRNLWKVFFVSIPTFALLILLVAIGAFGSLPTFEELENPKSYVASEILSSDGKVIGKFYDKNRTPVIYEELPKHLVDALIATEDVRFYNHSGIDIIGIGAVVPYLMIGQKRGSSTISQQLAKNLFPREKLNKLELVIRKFKEWVIAVKLERSYTKEEIITMYLNTVEFGQNTYGIKSAARTYFNKFPSGLNMEEAAMMVGVLKGTTLYNPIRNPERAFNRRNTVISQMEKYGYISEEEKESFQKKDLKLNYQRQDHHAGLAPYFREMLRNDSNLREWLNSQLKPNNTPYDLYRDGLKIYTTIDSRLQEYAEEAVHEHIGSLQKEFFEEWDRIGSWKRHQALIKKAIYRSERYRQLKLKGLSDKEILKSFERITDMEVFSWKTGDMERKVKLTPLDSIKYYKRLLHAGFMSVDPYTGYIKAWVGGINHKHFQYDHVKTAKRQVGSTFKPFVYAFGIDNSVIKPCDYIPNNEICIPDGTGKMWCPENSGNKAFDGLVLPVKFGLANSINRMTAYVMNKEEPANVVKFVKKMGIDDHIPPYPSICLGVCDLTVHDMIGAYGSFVNEGFWKEPIYLLRVEDKYGNEIANFTQQQRSNQAMSKQTAYTMVKMMQEVVDGSWCEQTEKRHGTGQRLRYTYQLEGDIAGKTGTTQNSSDGWFIGMTPQLVSGGWVGCEDPEIHFRNGSKGQGAHMALPIWALYMKKIYADKSLEYSPNSSFKMPDNFSIPLDCDRPDIRNEDFDNISSLR